MGYKIVEVDSMRERYTERKGLEGPFLFSGRVLYYDTKEGAYWDPRSDFYISNDEMSQINNTFLNQFK